MKIPPVLNQKRKISLYFLVINGFLQASMTVLFSFLVKFIFDSYIYSYEEKVSVWTLGLAFVVITMVFAWLKYKERVDAEILGQYYIHELRNKMFSRLCKTDIKQLDYQGQGDIILRFSSDLSAIRQWISLGYARLVVASVLVLFVITTLCFISLPIAMIVITIMLINIFASFYIGKKMQMVFRDVRRSRSYLANNLTEKIISLVTIKVFGQRYREKSRIKRQSQRVVNSMIDRAKIIGVNRALIEMSLLLSTSIVLIIGIILVQNHSITAGSVVAAMVVVTLLNQPLRNIARIYEYWHASNIAREKLHHFLEEIEPTRRISPELIGQGVLKLVNIRDFNGKKQANMIIPYGKKIIILGENGSGKSTLLALIAGLMKPKRGKVTLDNVNVLKLHEKYLRQMIGMVSSSFPLIKGSIYKNICYRIPSASEEEINQVINKCELSKLLKKFKNGLEHRITVSGGNLSPGQQQKIILARALIGSPKILLLDEAETFLDEESRKLVNEIIENYDGTVILATHNFEQVKLGDEAWLLEDGGIKWCGKPTDLFNNKKLIETKND